MLLALTTVAMLSSGGLLSERAPAPGLLMGQMDLSELPIEQLSVPELEAERLRLHSERPGLGLGIALIVVGGVGDLLGLAMLAAAAEVFFLDTGLVVATLAVLAVGIAATVVGIALLVGALHARRENTERVRAIEARLGQIRRGEAVEPPPNELPPPPPMPGAALPVLPAVVLASF